MATKIDSGGGYQQGYDDGNAAGSASGSSTRAGKLHFPDGWSLHATALGEGFPGFGSNVIPVCMNGASRNYSWGRNAGSVGVSGTYSGTQAFSNGKWGYVAAIDGDAAAYCSTTIYFDVKAGAKITETGGSNGDVVHTCYGFN